MRSVASGRSRATTPFPCSIDDLQDVLNLLPNLNVSELVEAFTVKSNDMMVVMYLASLVRSITAIHNLITNKARAATTPQQEPPAPPCRCHLRHVRPRRGLTLVPPAALRPLQVVNKETEKAIDALEMGTGPGPVANGLEDDKEKKGEAKAAGEAEKKK